MNQSESGCEEESKQNQNADENTEEKRSYYYDDAHGYEDFDPDTDDDENDPGEPVKPGSDPARR
jgi:hypothetical protein